MAIEKVSTGNDRLMSLGIDVSYWEHNGVETHIQDLATEIAISRAQAVRDEMEPLSKIIRLRNRRSEKLGKALGELNRIETAFDSDAEGGTMSTDKLSGETASFLSQMGYTVKENDTISKAATQEYLQAIKSEIDAINNRSQVDMNRAQQLVETSNGSYETASNLLDALVKSQGNSISGVGA